MNGVEINTRAYVATRLLLRWDYLYAVTLTTNVFGDYNHARLEVSWITSTRGLLLRGYTGGCFHIFWPTANLHRLGNVCTFFSENLCAIGHTITRARQLVCSVLKLNSADLQTLPQIFKFLPGDLVMIFQSLVMILLLLLKIYFKRIAK